MLDFEMMVPMACYRQGHVAGPRRRRGENDTKVYAFLVLRAVAVRWVEWLPA